MNRGYSILLTGIQSSRHRSRKLLKMSSRFASRLVYQEHGQPNEVIKLETFPEPIKAEDDNVIVRMLAAPVNPADINTIQGVYAINPPLPATGGGDGIGEVLQVGPKVKSLKPGDRVFPGGSMKGTWTTHYVDSEKNLVKTRKDLPLLSSATLRVNPGTAYRMLKDFVTLKRVTLSSKMELILQLAKMLLRLLKSLVPKLSTLFATDPTLMNSKMSSQS